MQENWSQEPDCLLVKGPQPTNYLTVIQSKFAAQELCDDAIRGIEKHFSFNRRVLSTAHLCTLGPVSLGV